MESTIVAKRADRYRKDVDEADCNHCAMRASHVREGDDPTNGLAHLEGDVFACPACGACYKRTRGDPTFFPGYTFARLPHADWIADALAKATRD